MKTIQNSFRFLLVFLMTAFFISYSNYTGAAPLLTITTDQSIYIGLPGDTLTVNGTITNRSDSSLDSTDLLLDFNNYNFLDLTPNQYLGIDNFTIPSFTFISNILLFTVDISNEAPFGTQGLQFILQDVNGNFSDPLMINIAIQGSGSENPDTGTEVPEPPTILLIIAGIFLTISARNRGTFNK